MRNTFLAVVLLSGALFSACGTDSATQQEAVAEPAQQTAALVPAGCPPGAANEKGVGGICTKGGRQCRGTASPVCSVDGSRSAPVAFCTRPCLTDGQCGSGAVCMKDPGNAVLKGCVPVVCLGS